MHSDFDDDDENVIPNKNYSVHTRDIPDWAYIEAHESLREDAYCPYPAVVATVARALIKARDQGMNMERELHREPPKL